MNPTINKYIIPVLIFLIILSWGTGIYFVLKNKDLESRFQQLLSEKQELVNINDELSISNQALVEKIKNLEKKISDFTSGGYSGEYKSLSSLSIEFGSLKMLIPEDLKLCVGKEHLVKWRTTASSKDRVVQLFAVNPNGGQYNLDLGTIYANQNEYGQLGNGEYLWRVGMYAKGFGINAKGEEMPEGQYRIRIYDPEHRNEVMDTSNPFQIMICEG